MTIDVAADEESFGQLLPVSQTARILRLLPCVSRAEGVSLDAAVWGRFGDRGLAKPA